MPERVDLKSSDADLDVLHGLPRDVVYCRSCVMSNQRPATTPEFSKKATSDVEYASFGDDGICDACKFYEHKKTIDWDDRKRQLEELCDRFRSKDGSWDVLVPGSGGKDSIFVSHILKYEYGMNPLTVTWAPHAYTEVGTHNMQAWQKSGFDNILVTPDPNVHSKVTQLAFKNLLNPFQPFIIGQKMLAPKMALKFDIKFLMYGENQGERHNKFSDALIPTMDPSHFTRTDDDAIIYLGGVDRQTLAEKHGLSMNDTHVYLPALREEVDQAGLEVHHMTTYVPWATQRNFYFAKEHTDFQTNPYGRSEGTFSKYASLDDKLDGFHYFTMFIKFGQARAVDDACRDIRDGYLSRKEGVALVRKFDGEFPARHFEFFLDYIDITKDEFWEVIDRNRSPHLWENNDNEWALRHPCL
jgi:N-acetyl sugar amidotransferase